MVAPFPALATARCLGPAPATARRLGLVVTASCPLVDPIMEVCLGVPMEACALLMEQAVLWDLMGPVASSSHLVV